MTTESPDEKPKGPQEEGGCKGCGSCNGHKHESDDEDNDKQEQYKLPWTMNEIATPMLHSFEEHIHALQSLDVEIEPEAVRVLKDTFMSGAHVALNILQQGIYGTSDKGHKFHSNYSLDTLLMEIDASLGLIPDSAEVEDGDGEEDTDVEVPESIKNILKNILTRRVPKDDNGNT